MPIDLRFDGIDDVDLEDDYEPELPDMPVKLCICGDDFGFHETEGCVRKGCYCPRFEADRDYSEG